ncbi:Xanthine dehydrogenase molybdenum-binding subunit [Aquisphaera giovannonii]|uniref:Xanthine dehydrogenase molybdenum-binding subunit n=1 Tax=Aquisphaera giovannonii TaxID=406548 RepID=A0A5B9VWU5_9BACT|nr:xanthine dehydrogenase family protein molybdopterin-binding subunit [Aquisphaera giovannonii]QEH32732.1 Xanthine dehydrogenase molybdenum-binding subunit [Aquisphaera giovannonii]
MPATWPENPRLIGTRIPRVDGLAKASGRAKYPSDVRPEGMLFAVLLHSPHAHAKIKSIDTSAAEKLPGVKAVSILNGEGKTVRFHGDDIAAVAAETEEQARDAVRAIKVEYEVLPHVVTEPQAMAPGAPEAFKGGNVRKGRAQVKGKPEDALAKADVVVEGTYSLPVITHVCLEPHGLTAKWDADDKLTVWASTQAVQVTAGELADAFSIPVTNVTVLTDYMGGGFGSKFGAETWGRTAAELAKKAGRPVRLFLDREQEHLAGGNRPSASGKVRIGATKDGKIVGLIAETHGTGGGRGGSNFPFPYVYSVPDVSRSHSEVFVNGGAARAMRAPGHPQGCAIMEAAMDDLADKLGIDPIEFRLRNLDPNDFRTAMYQAEVKIGAELIGWKERRKPRGQDGGGGPIKHGLGMGLHQWGGGGTMDKKVSCTINPDGSVEMKAGTQDIGTGIRTLLAIIAAEVLGLEPKDVISSVGNSSFPPGQPSGGSTTTPSMAPPALDAATKARDALLKKIAGAVKAAPEELTLKDGQLFVRGEPQMGWKDACRKLGGASISETGSAAEGLASTGVAGCQFAEVAVDIETGVVRVKKIVAVQDSGLILDRLTWDSQVYGGVIMGLNYGLFEERIMDPATGVMLNPDMEMYKLAGASDIPEIVIHAYDPDDQKARGVIGIGEPPTIATAAAIANAVTNAIGVRVPEWPMSPRNVLNALATASKEGKA